MITGLPSALSDFHRPSWQNTFSCAFSRIEQVLTSTTSASVTSSVSSSPSAAASPSAMRAESYSFIWQPWVGLWSFFAAGTPAAGLPRGGEGGGWGAGRGGGG